MLYAIVAVLALILDQAVKYWTTVNIVVDTGIRTFIPGVIRFANIHNTGAAFSFLEGARWFFVVLCIVFVLIVVYALAKDLITHPVCRWAAVIVMAGAIGNCIDRIVCGYVVDMLEFEFLFFNRRFPVFNVADIYITLGVIVFCVALLLEKPANAKGKTAPVSAPASDAAPAPKAPRRPLLRKRQKIEIPTFEKHDLPEVPALDPNDPFAEWEKRAAATRSDTKIYTQPVPAAPTEPDPVQSVQPEPVQPAEPAPAQPAPTAPEAPAQPAAEKPAARDEFDLDNILAEFKDL